MRLPTAPMRVLLANDRLGYENARLHGAGRLMIQWTRGLVARGVDVTSVILRGRGSLGEAVLDEGLPFHFLDRHPYDPRTLLDFLGLIRDNDIQVLHLQAFGASTFGRIAGRLTGRPSIVHVHADYRNEPKGYPAHVRLADRWLATSTGSVLAISNAIRDFAVQEQSLPAERVEVLHNPVDLNRFRTPSPAMRETVRAALGLDPDVAVAVCVARFDPVKGVDVLVRAWASVVQRLPRASLLLVGDGPERNRLSQIAGGTDPTNVRFLGYLDDVEVALQASDVAVVPSRSEGLSIAALEAMACGLPVVASRVGGLPEIVKEGETGWLVPPEDPDALADALIEGLADPETTRARAQEHVEHMAKAHDLNEFLDRLLDRYERVAGRAPRHDRLTKVDS